MATLPPIDLNTVPSAMELRAAAWTAKAAIAPPMRPARKPSDFRRIARPSVPVEREERRAERDAFRALAKDVPDPGVFASCLGPQQIKALLEANQGRNGWRVRPEYVADLRALGLVEVGGSAPNFDTHNHLTAFGMAVRRRLVKDGE